MLDVIVIGGGPAGAAAALVLLRRGLRVALIDHRVAAFKPGEGIAPGVKSLLRELDLYQRFLDGGHLPSYGNLSAWGRDTLTATDFLHHPHGHGFHVDRLRFDAMLRDAAAEAGVLVLDERVAGSRNGAIELANGAMIEARFLIDATGRSSWLARRNGATRVDDDSLIACVALFDGATGDEASTLIESTPDGWWYTAPLPGAQRVAVFHTDAPLPERFDLAHFLRRMEETRHVRQRLRGCRPADGFPLFHRANSARLDRVYGRRWIAAGDAALSFDPLSSQGILTALYGGMRAGEAVAASLAGDRNALHEYARVLSSIYLAYIRQHHIFYSAEVRWPEAPFWRRRHTPLTVSLRTRERKVPA
jgi:flavin-dependent dehydrogenase